MPRDTPPTRTDFSVFVPMQTRWADNDLYGHLNNVSYYSYFDSAINAYLIGAGVLDIHTGAVIGLVAETSCQYFQALAFPDALSVGLKVAHLGRSSVHYQVAVFREGEDSAAAAGQFVHVYVDRLSRRPLEVTGPLRSLLENLRQG